MSQTSQKLLQQLDELKEEKCPWCGLIIVERFVGSDGVVGCSRSCMLESEEYERETDRLMADLDREWMEPDPFPDYGIEEDMAYDENEDGW